MVENRGIRQRGTTLITYAVEWPGGQDVNKTAGGNAASIRTAQGRAARPHGEAWALKKRTRFRSHRKTRVAKPVSQSGSPLTITEAVEVRGEPAASGFG